MKSWDAKRSRVLLCEFESDVIAITFRIFRRTNKRQVKVMTTARQSHRCRATREMTEPAVTHVPADPHPASRAASELVSSFRPWTKRDQRVFRIKLVASCLFPGLRRRLRNDRAARRSGFAPNRSAMSLPYNNIHPSSLDALSSEQRSEASSDIDPAQLQDSVIEEHRQNLDILPVVLWSMGKSFHIGDRGKRLILREARHAKRFPNGDRTLLDKYEHERPDGLIAWALPLPFILGSQSGYWRANRFLALSYFLGCALLDRTGTLNDELGIKLVNLHPIPAKDPSFRKELRTICWNGHKRASTYVSNVEIRKSGYSGLEVLTRQPRFVPSCK